MKYSIVIPAYNEYDNLKIIIDRFSSFIKTNEIEVIIVNNASVDDSETLLEEMQKEYEFLKVITIKVNEGYGNGVKQGILSAKGEYIGWMHADLQSDVADMFKAIEIIENSKDNKVFVKGLRKNRGLMANFFTLGMATFAALLFKQKFYDLGAQPNIFNRTLLDEINIDIIPKDWLFDTYFYYCALKNGYKIKRFSVNCGKRIHGQSFWNTGLLSRFKVSFENIKSFLKLKKAIDNAR